MLLLLGEVVVVVVVVVLLLVGPRAVVGREDAGDGHVVHAAQGHL